jgi:hypothetical protein
MADLKLGPSPAHQSINAEAKNQIQHQTGIDAIAYVNEWKRQRRSDTKIDDVANKNGPHHPQFIFHLGGTTFRNPVGFNGWVMPSASS